MVKLLKEQCWRPPVLPSIHGLEWTLLGSGGAKISPWRVKYLTPVGSRVSNSDAVHLHGFKPETAGMLLGGGLIAH